MNSTAQKISALPGTNIGFSAQDYKISDKAEQERPKSKKFIVKRKDFMIKGKTNQKYLAYQPQLQNYYMDSLNFVRSGQYDNYIESMVDKYQIELKDQKSTKTLDQSVHISNNSQFRRKSCLSASLSKSKTPEPQQQQEGLKGSMGSLFQNSAYNRPSTSGQIRVEKSQLSQGLKHSQKVNSVLPQFTADELQNTSKNSAVKPSEDLKLQDLRIDSLKVTQFEKVSHK
ncbi:Hypothetical_protein [Hexamita inflata]|uniref:Hypothetical_protein n=1 Tax=Hexamita inflata TaxID=28002 RepID=A0AA86Q640_9EUKA|nr:Hypothetical protein HINF_LOCUS38906 [Hexamita inflata]